MPARSLFLPPTQLSEVADRFADEVRLGRHAPVHFDAAERWHRRIHRDRTMDVWLISWLPSQGTQLHDHGGSSGAFTVLDGELCEAVVRDGRMYDRVRSTGSTVAFGPRYVHDVRNVSETPAVSVHAYSPPLTTMNYYDLAEGRLEQLASLATDDPEPDFELPARERRAAS